MAENISPRHAKSMAIAVYKDERQVHKSHQDPAHVDASRQKPMDRPKQPLAEQPANADHVHSGKRKHGNEDIDDDDDYHLNGYEKLHKIGEGTYGVVFKARQKVTNKIVAMKKIRLHRTDGIPVTAMREIAILKEMAHTNVIGLTDLVQRDMSVYIVSDFLEMDLRNYMDGSKREGMTPRHIKSYMHQLLRGLQYCHSHRILHRDLKPQNLLIDKTGRLTIADLGLSRAFGVPLRTYTHQVVTLWYRAPEILLGSHHYSTGVDMWSVGCIFAEMMTLRPVFPGDSQIDQLYRIFRVLGTPNEELWPGVSTLPDYTTSFPAWETKNLREVLSRYSHFVDLDDLAFDLLQCLLAYDPACRISAKRASTHSYFFTDPDDVVCNSPT